MYEGEDREIVWCIGLTDIEDVYMMVRKVAVEQFPNVIVFGANAVRLGAVDVGCNVLVGLDAASFW